LVERQIQLDQILDRVAELRPLTNNVKRLIRALDDPALSAAIAADLVGLDQALAAHVLRLANSVYIGYRSACGTLREAVMRIGTKRLKTLALGVVVTGPLSEPLDGYRFGKEELWHHSLATATIAHWLAVALRYPEPEEAYVAGLIHDIGKLVLDQHVEAAYHEVVEIVCQNGQEVWQVEQATFGIDHANVGGLIAREWQFPEKLVSAVQFHHSPGLARPNREQTLAAIINLANAYTPELDGIPNPLVGRVVHEDTEGLLGLTPEAMVALKMNLEDFLENNPIT
jgi:putative nucleotidyltransferase with HDIG domain